MTDKVQKIREEVARIQLYTQSEVLKQVLDYIDEVQKEPVSDIWHDASEPPIIDKTFLLVAPNGNSSLCLWGGKELHSVTIGGGHSVLCKGDIYSYIDDLLNLDNSCNFGKNLQEEPVSMWHDASEEPKPNMELICVGQYGNPLVLSSNSDSFKERYISKWAYFNDLLNLSNAQRTTKDCKEPVSDDLEDVQQTIIYNGEVYTRCYKDKLDAFACKYPMLVPKPSKRYAKYSDVDLTIAVKKGAQWQKEQFEKNRLAHCDAQTEEEAEIERVFVMRIIENEHRQPTFDDAIKYGMGLQRENMMKGAVNGLVYAQRTNGEVMFRSNYVKKEGFEFGDKVKVIVIKED